MPYFWQEAGKTVERVYSHYHASTARHMHQSMSTVAVDDLRDSSFLQCFLAFSKREDVTTGDDSVSGQAKVGCAKSTDAWSMVSLDIQRCSLGHLYSCANRDGAKLKCQMLELEKMNLLESSSLADVDLDTVTSKDFHRPSVEKKDSASQSSDSGHSVHSDDLFESDTVGEDLHSATSSVSDFIRDSQVCAFISCLFNSFVDPYQKRICEVLKTEDIMGKLRLVWQSVDWLSQKAGDIFGVRGMDTLLPMSIFAMTLFPEDVFVDYYVQLLILQDIKPAFIIHSIYDFSLTSAFSIYLYLFEMMTSRMRM